MSRIGTAATFVLCVLTATVIACGERSGGDLPPPAGQAAEYRSRAQGLEANEDLDRAIAAYREASRRYPTEAWPWSGIGRTARRLGRYAEALDGFREAVRWDSMLVEERAEVAELLLADGKAIEALEWIDEHLRLGGETASALALRARALARAGRIPEARKELEHSLALDPTEPSARIARALVLLESGATTTALAELDGLKLARPEDPDVLDARAKVYVALGNDDAAIADLARALELDPQRPRTRIALARLYTRDNRLSLAAEEFRSVLELNPRDPDALEGLGTCALALGDREEAETAFRRAIEFDPEFAAGYLALGRLVASKGSREEAIALLRKARARATLDPELWEECSVALADAYFALGEPEHAMAIAEAMLSRHPGSERGRTLRGRALVAGGGGPQSSESLERIASHPEATSGEVTAWAEWLLQHDESDRALAVLDRRLEERPDDVELRIARARVLGTAGRFDEAEAALHGLLPDGGSAVQLALARLYFDAQRWPDALFHAYEGKKIDPANPDFYAVIGAASLARGDLGAARVSLERERDLRPRNVEVWMNLGRLEMEAGNPDSAATLLRRAREIDPDHWRVSYLLGLAETRAGRPDQAIAAYRTVLATNERVAEAHNNLAWLLADLELDPVLAEVHARRAMELRPGNPHILGTLGWAQYKNRSFDQAAATLRDATRLLPGDAMKHYMLGVVELDRGRREAARVEIRKALDLDPRFERAGRAGELLESLEG